MWNPEHYRIRRELESLSARLQKAEAQISKPRGVLDALSALSPLISGILIAGVGTIATILYNDRQLQLTQLTALDKYRSYLASEDPQERLFGYQAFVALGQEDFVVKLVAAKQDQAGRPILAAIADQTKDSTIKNRAEQGIKALGRLSEKYESGGDPGAIGYDNAMGWSYGMYQFSFNNNLVDFLKFLQKDYPELSSVLESAGGIDAAHAGKAEFTAAWKALSANAIFGEVQRTFVSEKYFMPAVILIRQRSDIDVLTRTLALQNVVWSMAVQYGRSGAASLLERALAASVDKKSDGDIIKTIYQLRIEDIPKTFKRAPEGIRSALVRRYEDELNGALQMLSDSNDLISESPGLGLLRLQARRYPMVSAWLRDEFPKIYGKAKVWDAFLRFSHLSDSDARKLVNGAIGPLMFFREMNGVNSLFSPANPNRVDVSIAVAVAFESDPDSNRLVLERTVLVSLARCVRIVVVCSEFVKGIVGGRMRAQSESIFD